MEVENVSSRRKIGSVKFSEKRGEKNSIEFDSISHLLDIHLDRGVINKRDSARILVIHSMFKPREESGPRVVSSFCTATPT